MDRSSRSLLQHPIVRTLLFERFLLTASATLAFAATAMGRVRLSEIPVLMDWRILSLFFVLTVAVELGKASDLFDRLVATVIARARTARGLALAMIATTGILSAALTNDVALFLVVPFTMLFRKVANFDLAPLVVLEVLAANLLGAITPIGNPQNLFLYARGGFSPAAFLAAQLPLAGCSALLLAFATLVLVPARALPTPPSRAFDVEAPSAAAFFVLLAAELLSILGTLPHLLPLALSLPGLLLLGRRLREADFSLLLVFAFLFIGIPGLERGELYRHLSPERVFGHQALGLLFSGALLSQVVSNVPAALLLAPAAAPLGFQGLLYGVTVGACGSPVGAIANLIGAQIYVTQGGAPRTFWRIFLPLSTAFLAILLVFAALWLRLDRR
jgi:Na+/H+ antiporter NhaD/arsenite permease-like protein